MRIGFLLFHPLTESLGSIRRVLDLATGLKRRGFDPIIITPFGKRTKIQDIDVEVIPSFFSNLGVEEHLYKVARKLSYRRSFVKFLIRNMGRRALGKEVAKVLGKIGLDILQIEQEPLAIMALPLKRELPVPLVLDFHGIWAEELADLGLIARQDKEYYMLKEMVRNAVAQMDAVIVMSEEMKQYIIHDYDARPEKVYIVGMGAQRRINELPSRDRPTKVIYAGVFSRDKHVDLFLKSIPYVIRKKRDITFYITKKGDLIDEAFKVRKETGANIRFFWFDEEKQLFEFMSKCHIGVLTLPNNLSYRMNPAAKFFDYLSVGLPVVANDIGGWTRIIDEDGIGILTNDDPKVFAEDLLHLVENRDLTLYSLRCLEVSKIKYNLDAVTDKLLALYKRLLDK